MTTNQQKKVSAAGKTEVINVVHCPRRIEFGHEDPKERIKHFGDFTRPLTDEQIQEQSRRCLHCGTPFCSSNCPLHNRPVDFNALVRAGRWHEAWECLNSTSSFPEFTSRVCPAICEVGCTQYYLNDEAVGIKTIERAIIDRAWRAGWVKPEIAAHKSGKRVAVVGSGPAGLSCAQQLARVGHNVTVFEKAARPGGLLRYGISDFKLEKDVVDRRIEQMQAEGVKFECGVAVGDLKFPNGVQCTAKKSVTAQSLIKEFDAVVLACGSETPRDLPVPGREGAGVHFALELLVGQNRVVAGEVKATNVSSAGCDVVVVGGGDTGSDCVGIARRQGAGKVYQIDLMPKPPVKEDKQATWPNWPVKLRESTSHEEGCDRLWETSTKEIVRDKNGAVTAVKCVKLKWTFADGKRSCTEVPGSEFEIACQRVYLAMGFTQPSANVLAAFGVDKDGRGNAKAALENGAAPFATSVQGVFACGDVRSGQSLVVRAMSEGRRCARAVDVYLTGGTELPEYRL
ncbi:MAG: glutamate synthase subunit beta [Duodenibacillus sp.]|nr:glutamate synthase subunit beta [Duodenibacillus sp.]